MLADITIELFDQLAIFFSKTFTDVLQLRKLTHTAPNFRLDLHPRISFCEASKIFTILTNIYRSNKGSTSRTKNAPAPFEFRASPSGVKRSGRNRTDQAGLIFQLRKAKEKSPGALRKFRESGTTVKRRHGESTRSTFQKLHHNPIFEQLHPFEP